MPYTQPNRAPESCRLPLCGYLEQRTAAGEHHDRCEHGIPMHGPNCAWHRTPDQIAALAAEEQAKTGTVQVVHEAFSRRNGL